MRTAQRDQGGTITFSALVGDAPSGSGVAQPGAIPFTFTRTATGTYSYNVDTRLRVLAGTAGVGSGAPTTAPASMDTFGPGTWRVIAANSGAAYNLTHTWTVTALDKRT